MAIIYSYPQINLSSISADDLMIISDMNADGRPTKSLTLKNLADFVTSTGTGTGTTNAIIKWSDGPAGLLGDSIMTENATQIDLAGTFLSTSSPTATAGPVHAIRANQSTTTGGAFNIALYGDTKHTGATQANSNYGIYTKAEFEGTGGYTGIILGGSFEGRYDGSGTNGANASIYGTFSKANVTGASSGDIQYMIANNVSSEMGSGTTTDVEFLQGQHTNVTLNSGNVSGDIAVNILDFDYTAGTLQGDFAYLQIQNDPVPTPVSGTARAINSDSTLPSHFSGDVEIPLIPTANAHATSKQYVDQQIASIPAGLVFQGNWDASTNTPTLASGVGTVGNYYVVSVAGNTNLDGITDWEVGDWAVFVEVGGVDKWDKIDQTFVQGAGATGQVSFWNGVNSVTGDNDLYWDNVNKRLGIGTTSPGYNLHVKKSGTNSAITIEGSTNSGANFSSRLNFSNKDISGNDIDFTIGLKKTNNFVFMGDAAANELMRIQGNTGNVGIGTTSPLSRLHVENDLGAAGTLLTLKNSNLTHLNTYTVGTVNKVLKIAGAGSGQDAVLFEDTLYVGMGSNTNVGIGTSSPSDKLEIDGGSGNAFIQITTPNANYAGIKFGDPQSAVAGRIQYYHGDNSMQFDTSGKFAFQGGNVGIGTDNPAAALDVVGRIGLNDGNDNVSVGDLAGDALTTGIKNVAIGYNALTSEDTGNRNIAIGDGALTNLNFNGNGYNVAVGLNAGTNVTTGVRNIIIGGLAGDALTTGEDNVIIGHNAMSTDDAGGRNVALGVNALSSQNGGDAHVYNTGIGYNAGASMTSGLQNTIIGGLAGDALTTGSNNVAVGRSALSAEQQGGRNVAIGYAALLRQNTTGFAYNVAIGYNTGENITTGIRNTIIGGLAGDAINTGTENTLVGYDAGSALTTGQYNVALGSFALGSEDTHGRNIAIGYYALNAQDAGSDAYNIGIGHAAGANISTGIVNTIIGGLAGDAITTGASNVVIGYDAADVLLDGAQNTLVGDQVAGALTSGDENTYIGRRAASSATTGNQNVAIGAGVSLSSATVSNEANISNGSVIARFQGAAAAWSFVSDARDKKDIEDLELGIEFINKLKPRKFKWDLRDSDVDKNKQASGFVAQEIQEILDETGVGYTSIVDTNNPDQYTVAQANIIPMLVKAIQELSAEVKMLKNK